MVRKVIKYFIISISGIICLLLFLMLVLPIPRGINTEEEERLFWAIQNNNPKEVKSLLEKGVNPNQYYAGMLFVAQPLNTAATDNKLEIAKLLLEYGADPNKQSPDRAIPIWSAAFKGHLEMVDLLIKNGADPNISDSVKTPMIAAMAFGHIKVVKYLLEYGVDPNAHFSLIAAIDYWKPIGTNRPEIVQLLLEYGAEPNMRDNQDSTPLHYASSYYIYDIDSSCCNTSCNRRIVQLLLKHGANPNIQDKYGVTPIHAATFSGKLEILELLLKSDSTYDITYFSNAIKRRDKLEVIRLLLKQGIDPQIKAAGIYFAILSHELEILKLLLEHGVDPNMEYRSTTPINLAVGNQFFPQIKLLIKYGANLDAQTKTWIEKYVK